MSTSSTIFWNRICTFWCNYADANANLPPHLFVLRCIIICMVFLSNDIHFEYILSFKQASPIFVGVEMH